MGKYLIALIVLFIIVFWGSTALARQHKTNIADGTAGMIASDMFDSGREMPVLLAAGKEWNEDQREVVQSFQKRDNSINPAALNVIYTVTGIIVLSLLINYLRKRF
ncbi:hypothetical protein [Desulfotruncus alcoholivorax]|uniref:hypothetical protein n=1 Tax=Desulfotruncus alcoholivorax TaxID=265477 RepID=UPI0003FCD6BB|nr:hypothetical protein [Desulfotruncus alcoholivorax]